MDDLDALLENPHFVEQLNASFALSQPPDEAPESSGSTLSRIDSAPEHSTTAFSSGFAESPVRSRDGKKSKNAESIDYTNTKVNSEPQWDRKMGTCILAFTVVVLYFIVQVIDKVVSLSARQSFQPTTERTITTTITKPELGIETLTSSLWDCKIETKTVTTTETEVETYTSTSTSVTLDLIRVLETVTETLTESMTETVTHTEVVTETTSETVTKLVREAVTGSETIPESDQREKDNAPEQTDLALTARVLYSYTTNLTNAEKALRPTGDSCWIIGPDAAIGIELLVPTKVNAVVVHPTPESGYNNLLTVYDVSSESVKKIGSTVGNELTLDGLVLSKFVVRLRGNTKSFAVQKIEILA